MCIERSMQKYSALLNDKNRFLCTLITYQTSRRQIAERGNIHRAKKKLKYVK